MTLQEQLIREYIETGHARIAPVVSVKKAEAAWDHSNAYSETPELLFQAGGTDFSEHPLHKPEGIKAVKVAAWVHAKRKRDNAQTEREKADNDLKNKLRNRNLPRFNQQVLVAKPRHTYVPKPKPEAPAPKHVYNPRPMPSPFPR